MANDYFNFRQFTIRQNACAMKVGTDGTLLGAWANGGRSILDVGTGTGLIALMMAQRFPDAHVVGIDIDDAAVTQASDNVRMSPFSDRVDIVLSDVATFHGCFDAIVCNPPFFENSLISPDAQRTVARHTDSLPYGVLMAAAGRMLSDEGELSVIIPFDCKSRLESEAFLQGFFKHRECGVRTKPAKEVRRYLLSFTKHARGMETGEGIIGSEWYVELTKNFYI